MRLRPLFATPILLAASLWGAASVQAATFAGHDVNLVGSASILGNGDLQLTPPTADKAGAAWATTAWSTTDSFSTTFSFGLVAADFSPMADGIAFALQGTSPDDVGSGGGTIGLAGLDVVAFVVQTWDNNRVGLVASDDPFAAPLAGVDLGGSMIVTGTATVSYDADAKILSVSGSLVADPDLDDEDPGAALSFSQSLEVDLADRFGASMYAGFTGGTGLSYADQRITAWTIGAPVPEPETYALFLAGLGLLGLARRRR